MFKTSLTALAALSLGFSAFAAGLTGEIKADGSSTVFPITQAVADAFREENKDVRISVGSSGTGGGFKKFCAGDTDISNASRPIKGKELAEAGRNNVKFVELPVAYDGLSIVVNKENTWAKQITVDELKAIFSAGSTIKTWKDVNPAYPDVAIKLFGAGTDSGTFDYFKEEVIGKDGAVRKDMSASEDDNALVKGVEGDKGAIGFFGYAYFVANKDKLNVLSVVNPTTKEVIAPTPTTIENGTYAPFSRPLFIYVNKSSLDKPEIAAFAKFYIENAGELAEKVGYVRLPKAVYATAERNLREKKPGTQFFNDVMNEAKQAKKGSLVELYK